MIYALDSDIFSYILRGDEKTRKRWQQAEQMGNKTIIPLMVYYEVRRGLLAKDAHNRLRSFIGLCVDIGVDDLTVADMDTAAALYSARKRGQTIYDSDLLIAAQCITRGYTLVTHNTRHFEGINGLQLADWYI